MRKLSNQMIRKLFVNVFIVGSLMAANNKVLAQAELPTEENYFKMMKIPAPEGTILEVGGLCTLPNGTIAVTTRRGDVFMVENPTSQRPYFRKFAAGLHEALGAAYKDGALYVVQRGELTKLVDTDMDGKADVFETVYAWPLSGNYHEYSFGPRLAPDGSFFVTLNLGFPPDWWHPKAMVPFRGWALNITDKGVVTPWTAGFRSPCGISMIDGELWYTDNQGDWVGSGSIMKVKKGAFMGHPASLAWSNLSNSPVKLTTEKFFANNNARIEFDQSGQPFKPQNIVEEKYRTLADAKKEIPELQLPAVWLPHGILGISNSEIVKIPQGVFGPFSGQLLVGDQGQSIVSRIFLEEVNGESQGAAWAFRSGFQSGIVRLAWLPDGSLVTGETNRGWGSAGEETMGLERLVWNNNIPFEMLAIRAKPDGFEIEFTKPVDKKLAEDLASYSIESFTYKYQGVYGSPPVGNLKCNISGVKVSEDGLRARIVVANLRKNFIHTITIDGLRDTENLKLLHPTAYYTLNNIPSGDKLDLKVLSTKNSKAMALNTAKPNVNLKTATAAVKKVPTYEEVKPLLMKNTCSACHNPNVKQVGPAFKDIAKRKYTIEEIMQLIKNPKPEHWPDYSTPMPPMPQVSAQDARMIASWITSLNK
ncbi:MAG: c-type cytochrome [Pedobacter sp.]